MNALFKTIFESPHRSGYVRLDRRSEVVGELSYAELVATSRRRAGPLKAALASRRPNERVCLVFDDPLQFSVAWFACLYLGRAAMPVAPRQLAWVGETLRAAHVGLVVVEEALAAGVRRWRGDWSTFLWSRQPASGAGQCEPEPAPVAAEDAVVVQLSSGTTGEPTPIEVSARNVWSNERAIARHFRHGPRSRVFGWLPHTHDMGLFGTLLQPFFVDCVGFLGTPSDFVRDPSSWLRSVSRHRVSTSGAPTFAYGRCADMADRLEGIDLAGWRVAFVGAEPVRAPVMHRFCARFAEVGFDPRAVLACYGLAEATLFVAGEKPGRGLRTLTGVAGRRSGLQLADDELVRVGDAPNTGAARVRLRDVGLGAGPAKGGVGEILVAGPSVACPGHATALENDWLATGDLGLISDGGLYVCGRLKDVIQVRGRSVALSEVDRWIDGVLDDPRIEVCTFERRCADGELSLGVVLQPRRAAGANDVVAESGLAERVATAVRSRFGAPVAVAVGARPRLIVRTPSGKLRRAATRAACDAGGVFDG